jgi:hypothetical protein
MNRGLRRGHRPLQALQMNNRAAIQPRETVKQGDSQAQ